MNITEANAVNKLLQHFMNAPRDPEKAREAARLLVEKAYKAISAGMTPAEFDRLWPEGSEGIALQPVVEIIHGRDPDSTCGHTVFVNGVRVDNADIADLDPGRGWTRADWDEYRASALSSGSPAFLEMLEKDFDAYDDSVYIEEPDGAPCCPDPGCSGNPCTFPGYAANH